MYEAAWMDMAARTQPRRAPTPTRPTGAAGDALINVTHAHSVGIGHDAYSKALETDSR